MNFIKFVKQSKWDKRLEIYKKMEKNGFHMLETGFYSPIPTIKEILDETLAIKEFSHINWNENDQISLLENLQKYSTEFNDLIKNGEFDLKNGSFGTHDAPVYYSIIRYFKPKLIVEIGAGHSTRLSAIAASKNEDTKITAIDPYVQKLRKVKLPESINFIEKPVQQVPLSFFEKISENDILFYDGSHSSKRNSDVNFFFLKVLPILKPGVIIHIHDIFLPKDYPQKWTSYNRLFWNEQYLLTAFLIGNKNFEIKFAVNYMGIHHPQKLNKLFDRNSSAGGGSLWIKKIS